MVIYSRLTSLICAPSFQLTSIMAYQVLGKCCLDPIPNEILSMIMASMPDLRTLSTFLKAYPSSRPLYRSTYKKILSGSLYQQPSLQIAKLMSTVISIRNEPSFSTAVHPTSYFDDRLESEQEPVILDSLRNPEFALADIAQVSSDIEQYIREFLTSRLREPSVYTCAIHPVIYVPSQQEMHRIRRAFWRLQLLFSMIRKPFTPTCEDLPSIELAHLYTLNSLKDWELEEVICVYAFLEQFYHEARIGSHPASFHEQIPIIQRLLLNVGHNPNHNVPEALDIEWPSFLQRPPFSRLTRPGRLTDVFWFPRMRNPENRPRLQTAWSYMPLANAPNIGWQRTVHFFGQRQGSWIIQAPRTANFFARLAPHGLLSWGYCMWDAQRILNWGLLHRGGLVWLDRLSVVGARGGGDYTCMKCVSDRIERIRSSREDLWVRKCREL